MIKFRFSAIPYNTDNPDPFDMGDMEVIGEFSTVSSVGNSRYRMMIYLAILELLHSAREVARGRTATVEFVGTDSSFIVTFRTKKGKIEARGPDGNVIGTATRDELVESVVSAVETFMAGVADRLPSGNPVTQDLKALLDDPLLRSSSSRG
jgi:hypothetical protein